jgi:hypothetical protein
VGATCSKTENCASTNCGRVSVKSSQADIHIQADAETEAKAEAEAKFKVLL